MVADSLPLEGEFLTPPLVAVNAAIYDGADGSPLSQDLLEVAEQRRFRLFPYRRLVKEFEFPALP